MRTEITSAILPWKRPRWRSPKHNNVTLLARGVVSLAIFGMGLPWIRQAKWLQGGVAAAADLVTGLPWVRQAKWLQGGAAVAADLVTGLPWVSQAKWLQGGVAAAGLGGIALQIKCHRELQVIRARPAYVGNDPSWPPTGTGGKWDKIVRSRYQGYVYGEDGQQILANSETEKPRVRASLILAIEEQHWDLRDVHSTEERLPIEFLTAPDGTYCFARPPHKYQLALRADNKLHTWDIEISDRGYAGTCKKKNGEEDKSDEKVFSLNLNGLTNLILDRHRIDAKTAILFKTDSPTFSY